MVYSSKRGLFVCPDIDCGHTINAETAVSHTSAMASLADQIERLPAVLSRTLNAQLCETHLVMRLHRLCDSVEVLTRFLTIVGWMDLRQALQGRSSKDLLDGFRRRIPRPTFGMWAEMLCQLATAERSIEGLLLPELSAFTTDHLLPLLGSGNGDADFEIISLRNLIAHGGGLTHEAAAAMLCRHEPRVARLWHEAAFASEVTLAQVRGGELAVLVGAGQSTELRKGPKCLDAWLSQHDRRIILLRGERAVSLWPLLDFDHPSMSGTVGHRVASEPAPLTYLRAETNHVLYSACWGGHPLSQSSGALEEFQSIFELALRRSSAGTAVPEDFRDEISADAERLIGRFAELAVLKAVLKEPQNAPLWVTGPGGMGKTLLMARVAQDLSNAPPKRLFVIAYRFKAGDSRCSRVGFLRLATREIRAWLKSLNVPLSEMALNEGLAGLEDDFESLLRAVSRLETRQDRDQQIPRLLIILDGLDELIRYDADFPDLIFRHRVRNVIWLCAGRPDGALPQVFSPERCRHVFAQGLPKMSAADVRAMLVEACESMKYDLVVRDFEQGGFVHNAFVNAVVRQADGLPLYVRFVTEELNRGDLTFRDEGRLPAGLAAYYEAMLQRVGISDLQEILTALIVTICHAEGPLTPSGMEELFVWRGLLADGALGRPLLDRAILAAQAVLRPAPTANGAIGYIPYHDTFRAHVRLSEQTGNAAARTRRDLARAAIAWREFAADGDARRYLQRHGLSHLLAEGLVGEAVHFVNALKQHPEDASILALADRQLMERNLLLALNRLQEVPKGQTPIDANALLTITLGFGDEFELFRGAMRQLLRQHRAAWDSILHQVIASENWEVMYAASIEMAAAAVSGDDEAMSDKLLALAGSSEMARHEVGLLALKLVAQKFGAIDEHLLVPFLAKNSFIRRASLGELLINFALNGHDVCKIFASNHLLDSVWPYHQAQFEDVVAMQWLVRGEPAIGPHIRPGVLLAYAELAATEARRSQLVASPTVFADSSLRQLVNAYHDLPAQLHLIGEAQFAMGRSAELAEIALLLFGHPSWEVRASAGVTVGSLWSFREDLAAILHTATQHSDWRIRYAGLGATFSVRTWDGGALFEASAATLVSDRHSWVRGLAADTLNTWILHCDAVTRERRIKQFTPGLKALLADDDMWPLESVQLTLRQLAAAGHETAPFIASARGILASIDNWSTLTRAELQDALDAAKGIR